ncbi:4-(cytidine 5'-diphospho)-2-C-methyl-D-erythritol kinase [cf. Phormidesmis sp. LEGE 11477]|uniref:4-(cytidine 5'-diphospho)-2-C-methyl-D-erythritol kinase n=1 Tax=cf. Phormidesmis sp. LEGE 11477 TaxID=1828680 RepID=UPI00187F03AA|nr:4-(cytidine 5'-diphospho)-2-C-methyl-D-erythritol kinase [cf. Phormidesmis sp. LEGE 11477]MBE9063314.1 4-(cytidine 5'-diphospho)-2-C-methyl-D-erythritol kinase [cf. Phormidesmis sp. LEGE 11477]
MLTLFSNAKINLYLEIIGSRPDGFHELVMVMQSVALADRITLRPIKAPNISIECDHPLVPTDSTNLAYKAVSLLQKRFPNRTNQRGGVEIKIEKKIPVGAGLAGGSSNAAAALFGLDVLWDLGLTRVELQELGAELGSDVPFCLVGGCAIATGRGEAIDSIPNPPKLHTVLAKYTSLSVSTPWAYKTYRQQFDHTYKPLNELASLEERRSRLHSGPMVKAIGSHDTVAIGTHLSNDLEKVVLPAHPKVMQLKEVVQTIAAQHNGIGTMMSGSGPTVFALIETAEQAQAISNAVRQTIDDPDLQIYTAEFTSRGISHH